MSNKGLIELSEKHGWPMAEVEKHISLKHIVYLEKDNFENNVCKCTTVDGQSYVISQENYNYIFATLNKEETKIQYPENSYYVVIQYKHNGKVVKLLPNKVEWDKDNFIVDGISYSFEGHKISVNGIDWEKLK